MGLRYWIKSQLSATAGYPIQQTFPFDPPESFSETPKEHPELKQNLEQYMPEMGTEEDEWFDGFYHVTTNLPAVASWGALKSREQLGEGAMGLGGGFKNEAQDKVSLTHNLGKANQIYDGLTYAAEVAHGMIPPSSIYRDVIDWMGFPDDFLTESPVYRVLRKHLTKKQIRELDWDDMGKILDASPNLRTPEERYGFMIEVEDAIMNFEQEGEQDYPTNRVGFTAPFETFSKINPSNIGIVQLRLRKGAPVEHVPQEQELRVAPDDIQIVRVVKHKTASTRGWIRGICKFASLEPTSMTQREWIETNLPGLTFDQMLEEPAYTKYRALKNEWQREMEKGLATGRISPQEAESKKFYLEHGHGPLPQEPLYHVTTAKDSVISEGLKTRDELKQSQGKGLGGGTSSTISFTTDLDTAKGIYSSLIEAKNFTSGKMSFEDLIDMAVKGTGAKRPWINNWMGYLGLGSSDKGYVWNGQIPKRVQETLNGYDVDSRVGIPRHVDEMTKDGWEPIEESKWTHGTSDGYYQSYRRKMTPEKHLEEVFQYFKAWNTFREEAGGPLNPVYFSSDPVALSKVPGDQIAILEFRARPKAYGRMVSGLGEWRTYSGDAVEFVRVVS